MHPKAKIQLKITEFLHKRNLDCGHGYKRGYIELFSSANFGSAQK
jgi:hypothetical protein